MAEPPPPEPQSEPREPAKRRGKSRMIAVRTTWKPADQARARPQLSCSKNISAFCAILFQRLSDDAHIGDARLFDCVHDGGEGSEGNVFIGADKNKLVARIANFLLEPGGDLDRKSTRL